MNINPIKQSQFELFPSSNRDPKEAEHREIVFNQLVLTLENVVVLGIVFIMTGVIFFSFGVERGKRLSPIVAVANAGVEEKNPSQINKNAVSLNPSKPTPGVVDEPVDLQQETENVVAPSPKEEILEIPLEQLEIAEKMFTVQVASFKQEKSAQQEAEKLQKIGHETFVVAKGSYSIVCVGKFDAKDAAQKFATNKLKSKYKDFLIRRL